MPTLSLIILSAMINTAAQLFLKMASGKVNSNTLHHPGMLILKLAMDPYLILGGICYVSSVAVWIVVLSRVPVSFAYPMASLAYVTTSIAAVIFFNEYLSMTRIIGILVIILGVYLVSRTA